MPLGCHPLNVAWTLHCRVVAFLQALVIPSCVLRCILVPSEGSLRVISLCWTLPLPPRGRYPTLPSPASNPAQSSTVLCSQDLGNLEGPFKPQLSKPFVCWPGLAWTGPGMVSLFVSLRNNGLGQFTKTVRLVISGVILPSFVATH